MNNSIGQKIWSFITVIVHAILSFLFSLFHKELTDEMFNSLMQFVKFGIVGISNTIISYVLYAGSLLTFKKLNVFSGIDYLFAQVIAFILSVLWSFYWNNKYVFRKGKNEKRSLWSTLLKTYISYSFTGLFLSGILLVFWVQIVHVSEFIAPIINLLVSVPLNFVINKFWAFKTDK